MSRGKQCRARAVVFFDGEKLHADCCHSFEFHVEHPAHSVRFADGQRVFWERDGEIVWA